MAKGIFLDRDNTIIEDLGYVYMVEDLEFLPGVIDGLRILQNYYLLIVVTNQEGIPTGRFTEEDYFRFRYNMHLKLKEFGVKIEDEYYCPHLIGGIMKTYNIECNCHKPNIGMFSRAALEHNIQLSDSWMIGDKVSDIKAGKAAGCKTVGIYSRELESIGLKEENPDFVTNGFLEAANYIISRS